MSATITATTTVTASGPTTAQVMSFWSALHGGHAIGTRRPTAYPEWVTLEVAEGGFATGRAGWRCVLTLSALSREHRPPR